MQKLKKNNTGCCLHNILWYTSPEKTSSVLLGDTPCADFSHTVVYILCVQEYPAEMVVWHLKVLSFFLPSLSPLLRFPSFILPSSLPSLFLPFSLPSVPLHSCAIVSTWNIIGDIILTAFKSFLWYSRPFKYGLSATIRDFHFNLPVKLNHFRFCYVSHK